MRFQVSVIITDGSKFYLEKINVTKKEVKEVKKKYKIPEYYHNKAVFVAKLFNEYELKIVSDFLFKNDYTKSYSVAKINPFMLEDDVVPYSKIVRTSNQNTKWETISLGQINHMFIMGYGLAEKNLELRKIERNYQGCLILLELVDAEKTIENIDKLQNYLLNVKKIDNISEFANKVLNSKPYIVQKYANELRKLIFPSKEENKDKTFKGDNKIIKIPKDNWQN
jgi:hypothetical protein